MRLLQKDFHSNSDSPVPKLNISPAVRKTNSWSRPVTSSSNLDGRASTKESGQVVSEWTELMNADATAHHREHIFLQRLKKEKQKKFQKELHIIYPVWKKKASLQIFD